LSPDNVPEVPGLNEWSNESLLKSIMNTLKTASILAASVLAIASSASDITGKVTLRGAPSPERVVNLSHHAAIATKHPNGLTTRHYRVSSDNGLQDVLVYIRGSIDDAAPKPASNPATALDHVDGLFEPYVLGIQVDQPLGLKCTDRTGCSFISFSKVNKDFSIGCGPTDVSGSRVFSQPEVPVRLKCDLHPWNFAYVGVFNHSYFAVSDKAGKFAIKGVPPGQYTLEFFHPKSGTISKPIVVADTALTFELEIPAK